MPQELMVKVLLVPAQGCCSSELMSTHITNVHQGFWILSMQYAVCFKRDLLPECLGTPVTLVGVVINLTDFAVNIRGRLVDECLLALITCEKHPCS